MKSTLSSGEREFISSVARMTRCNHFRPERIQLEKEILQSAYRNDGGVPWNLDYSTDAENPNIRAIADRGEELLQRATTLSDSINESSEEQLLQDFESVIGFALYQRFRVRFRSLVQDERLMTKPLGWFDDFVRLAREWAQPLRKKPPPIQELAHHFAVLAQIERAFIFIFNNLVGTSQSMASLRAAVWESIFTCNFQRYSETMYSRMHELTTLITGPSGTGKELVARAIACSAFIPFDPQSKSFAMTPSDLFFALNLSALSQNLIESELFGHRRGAFTGAQGEHRGWLETCPRGGTVFLDEIGETDVALQVKLLRVLQTKQFQRMGENRTRSFGGKIIGATNRELSLELKEGRFREDFYYRLCSDVIETPSLHQQLTESPEDLPALVRFIARRLVGESLAETLTKDVLHVIETQVGTDYAWPGNFRELEQCVRSVLVRNRYQPQSEVHNDAASALAADLSRGKLTAEELLSRYCNIVFSQTNNIEETARRLDLDRRTVRARLDR